MAFAYGLYLEDNGLLPQLYGTVHLLLRVNPFFKARWGYRQLNTFTAVHLHTSIFPLGKTLPWDAEKQSCTELRFIFLCTCVL